MQTKTHWESVYREKSPTEVSWFQEHADLSLSLIKGTEIAKSGQIIDVGGGASILVDDLLKEGLENLTVLDISSEALQIAQARLGQKAEAVTWLTADITQVDLPRDHYDVWHDRAVFHFLTEPADRERYVEIVKRSVKAGGHVIVATFGPEGPLRCSGLPVMRYSPDMLHHEFGDEFELIQHKSVDHHTPFDTVQQFVYCYCRKK